MAPWPETGNEPKAPDKSSDKCDESNINEASGANSSSTECAEDNVTASKSEENEVDVQKDSDVANLNDGELKALLDEALTYKCPKDRVGKSSLFQELLLKAESDKPECGDEGNQRELNANRFYRTRRGIRHNVSTASSGEAKGGSLQNLAQDAAEFDSGGAHGGARSRRSKRGQRDPGVSVSARQREGGSLPSNVNVGGCGMKTSALLFEDFSASRPFSRQPRDSLGESSKPPKPKDATGLDTKSSSAMSREEISFGEFTSTHRSVAAAELLNDCYVVGTVGNCDGVISGRESVHGYEDSGVEMQAMGGEVVNYTTHATFEVADAARDSDREVDAPLNFPSLQQSTRDGVNCNDYGSLQEALNKSSLHEDRAKTKASGQAEMVIEPGKHVHSALGFNMSHSQEMAVMPSVRGMIESQSKETTGDRIVSLGPSFVMPEHQWGEHNRTRLECMQNSGRSQEGRKLTFYAVSCELFDQPSKQFSEPHSKMVHHGAEEKKYDENGNAIPPSERKGKGRKAKPKTNHKEYLAEHVTGYQGNKEIDELLRFIESDKERKNKCMLGAASKGPKIRKSAKSEDSSSDDKLKRSNSLEEVSKSKLEDLTSESSGVVRRPKKQATLDDADLRGDRRSWGTEEGQQYYCTDAASADETFTRRKRRDKEEASAEDADFLTVKKKQRRKNRRSSSGGRSSGGLLARYGQNQPRSGEPSQKKGGGFPPHDRDVLYQYRRPRSPDLRRKSTSSMPPSDKSDSSDLDSVHSLPVSSTKPTANLDASANSTPLASYADIAKISAAAPPANINVNATKWPAISGGYNHNPQFITAAKVNIGVPPVSGKSHASVVANEVVLAIECLDESSDSGKGRSDPRPKKKAAAAPVNFKTITPYVDEGQDSTTKPAKNSVTDDEDRGGASVETASECDVSNEDDADISERACDDKVDPVGQTPAVPCDEPPVPNHSDNNKVVNDNFIRDTVRVTTVIRRQVSSDPPKKRPPVIILDEKESLAATDSTLTFTFGFEVNEQLLSMEDETDLVDNPPVNGDCERTLNSVPVNEAKTKKPKSSQKPAGPEELTDAERRVAVERHASLLSSVIASTLGKANTEGLTTASITAGVDSVVAVESSEVVCRVEVAPKSTIDFSTRYRPPAEDETPVANIALVDFIGQAWREVFCTDGVTYFKDLSG